MATMEVAGIQSSSAMGVSDESDRSVYRGSRRSNAAGMKLAYMDCADVLLLLQRMAAVVGLILPRDVIWLIARVYRRVAPPLIVGNHSMLVLARDKEIWWRYFEDSDSGPQDTRIYKTSHAIRSAACGSHFAIVACDRGFYSWGSNMDGCLGDRRSCFQEHSPAYVSIGYSVIAIACGSGHVMMIVCDDRGKGGTNLGGNGRDVAESRLYGWGQINGLGLKYKYPRSPFECNYYDTPQQIDIDAPDAVACGEDYSLVLARGCVWMCCDDYDYGHGDHGNKPADIAGRGPRKLGFTNVIRMFACCHRFVIWSDHGVGGPPTTSAGIVSVASVRCDGLGGFGEIHVHPSGDIAEDSADEVGSTDGTADGVDGVDDADSVTERMPALDVCAAQGGITAEMKLSGSYVGVIGFGDAGNEDCCGIHERYSAWALQSPFLMYPRGRELCEIIYWPPARCWIEDIMMGPDLAFRRTRDLGRLIDVAGDRDRILVMTESCVYLLRDDRLVFVCDW